MAKKEQKRALNDDAMRSAALNQYREKQKRQAQEENRHPRRDWALEQFRRQEPQDETAETKTLPPQEDLFGAPQEQGETPEGGAQMEGIREEEKQEDELPIGETQIHDAVETLNRYKQGKANYDQQIVQNEEFYRMRHWEVVRGQKQDRTPTPEPASAWLLNAILAKHADLMDNFPQADILPRMPEDEETAEALKDIVPVILERNRFESTYDAESYYKLKHGAACYGVFWNKDLENGIGDIQVSCIDLLSLFWQPGVTNIQDSRNVFYVDLVDNDVLEEQYPQVRGHLGGDVITPERYLYDDDIDTSEKTAVVDWYYKKRVQTENGCRTLLHYCKFCGDVVLFASENDPAYRDTGWYEHGRYPFEIDAMYPIAGTPVGFGLIALCKDQQLYIDELDKNILLCAKQGSTPRYWCSKAAGVNKEQFLDMTNCIVDVEGTIDEGRLRLIETQPVSVSVVNVRDAKVNEIKETTSNRDVSLGATSGGITAASAIAALQESGNKNSRDLIQGSYRAFREVCYLVIELIRQFYDGQRMFRITDQMGRTQFVPFGNAQMQGVPMPEAYDGQNRIEGVQLRRPIFDIKVAAEKRSPYSVLSQNETAKEFYQLGFFAPENATASLAALDMMEFDGIEKVREKIQQNNLLFQQMQQMQAQMMAMQQAMGLAAEQNAVKETEKPGSVGPSHGKAINDSRTRGQKQAAAYMAKAAGAASPALGKGGGGTKLR